MKRVLIKTYKWEVADNFGRVQSFENRHRAEEYQQSVKRERRVINYIRPKGVTLVVSKNSRAWYANIPAFLGYDGVPYAQANKDRDRDFFMDLLDPIDSYRGITGDTVPVLKAAYRRITQSGETRLWNKKYGNSSCSLVLHPDSWTRGALWYNWDGKNFSTNDKKCKITNKDFK